ncbi:MAG TPA: baseplate J/gp47 family protein [Pyrinomonadaceae bacterium]|nr:baseplate J/gp47 family protein [Pyrinomonadaceae bacterium]
MNADTVNLIERPYREVVDDILTAIVGGVVNEPIIFDVKEDRYPLAEPAGDVRGITGVLSVRDAAGELRPTHHTFRKSVDFEFSEGENAVVWLEGGTPPDDETVFYVDYFRRDSRSPLTDINVGSVTRTLSEAVGREIATVYQQINEAYLAGFIDTAKGQSLDLVVSILGVKRKTKEFALGLVTFFRDPAAGDGNITIPEGVLLTTEKAEASFVTAELRTLQRGQVRIDVPVRATAASRGEAGVVKAGAITTLAQPITGIARVTNFEATVLGAEGETDEQLRARARARLRGLGYATVAALINAVAEGRGTLAEVFDPNSAPVKRTRPGTVALLIEAEPERFLSLRAAVEQTRAAGVLTTLVARYVFFKPRLVVRVAAGAIQTPAGKEKLVAQLIEAMQKYVDKLSTGESASGKELLKAVTEVKEVKEALAVDVMAWRSDIGLPGPESLVKLLVEAVNTARRNEAEGGEQAARDAALSVALANVLEGVMLAPTGQRVPDRGLVKGPTGQRATDAELEAGDFEVSAVADGQKWWVVLDVEPADIVLAEG